MNSKNDNTPNHHGGNAQITNRQSRDERLDVELALQTLLDLNKNYAEEGFTRKNFSNLNLINLNLEFEQKIVGFDFSGSLFSNFNFSNKHIEDCNFDGAFFKNTNFTKTSLEKCTFRFATMCNPQFEDTWKIHDCNFSGARIDSFSTVEAFTKYGFSKESIRTEDRQKFPISNCVFEECVFSNSNIFHVNFNNCTFRSCDFSGAILYGMDISGVVFEGTDINKQAEQFIYSEDNPPKFIGDTTKLQSDRQYDKSGIFSASSKKYNGHSAFYWVELEVAFDELKSLIGNRREIKDRSENPQEWMSQFLQQVYKENKDHLLYIFERSSDALSILSGNNDEIAETLLVKFGGTSLIMYTALQQIVLAEFQKNLQPPQPPIPPVQN